MKETMQISTNTPVKTEDNTTMFKFTNDSMTDGKGVAADVLSIEYLVTGIISVIFIGFKAILVLPHLYSIQCAVQ